MLYGRVKVRLVGPEVLLRVVLQSLVAPAELVMFAIHITVMVLYLLETCCMFLLQTAAEIRLPSNHVCVGGPLNVCNQVPPLVGVQPFKLLVVKLY